MQKEKLNKKNNYANSDFYILTRRQRVYIFFKTIFEWIICLLAVIASSPIWIITAIAIKIDSKGPIFFLHKRIGKNGKEFNCIKFRSMAVNANHDVAGYEYEQAEYYITKVGKVIRKLSIDELPQLLCVLSLKMSLIGYRPSQKSEYELNEAREKYNMYQIKPGLSGWAQVNGRDMLAANPSLKAEYDAYYLKNISLWLDIKIFFMTFIVIFKHTDVAEGKIEKDLIKKS